MASGGLATLLSLVLIVGERDTTTEIINLWLEDMMVVGPSQHSPLSCSWPGDIPLDSRLTPWLAATMGWTNKWAVPKCPACKTSVYPAEACMAVDRTPFHKQCVKCKTCAKPLAPSDINEHQTQLYCKACYDNVFCQKVEVYCSNSRKLKCF